MRLLDRLGVDADTRLVDLACGTGSFLVEAAGRGAEAHGVDVSEQMLAFTRRRAEDAGVEVLLHHAEFLTYQHVGPPLTSSPRSQPCSTSPTSGSRHMPRVVANMRRDYSWWPWVGRGHQPGQ